MVEMVSRQLQQGLLSSPVVGSSGLCGAMREAILSLCRNNLTYGGQVEVDGIICITGPRDGQQLVVKVHELLNNDKWCIAAKTPLDGSSGSGGGGGGGGDGEKNGSQPPRTTTIAEENPQSNSPEVEPPSVQCPSQIEHSSSPCVIAPVTMTPGMPEKGSIVMETTSSAGTVREEELEQEHKTREKEGTAIDKELDGEDDEEDDEEDEAPGGMSDHYCSEGLDSGRGVCEVEALDLRLDSPAARIKQEPLEYESESYRYHPYISSSSSGSIYRPSSTHDLRRLEGSSIGLGNSTIGPLEDRHQAADSGSGRPSTTSPHTPHTPLLVPFMGAAHHHHSDMAETATFPTPQHGASPFMDSRLRHLLAKMPYAKPRPGLPFLHRSPLFPTMSVLHSSAPECKACGFTFAQVELLKEHNEAVHAVFTCNVCYRTFTSRSNLDRHSRLHTGHKPYICVKCGKAFSRKDHLTNHSAKHAFKCGKCLKRFVEREALQGHYDQDHQVLLTNICEHCNKGFSDPAVFTEHLKSHPEYLGSAKIHPKHKPFACTECNYVCADKLQLLKHSQLHAESGRDLVYNCLACAETFNDPLLYSQHFEGHQEQSDIFECCICRKMCCTWRELKQHEQSHLHPSSRGPTLACPVCYIIFDNPDVLAEHVQSHDAMDLDPFPCNVCNEAFPSMEALQQHEQEEKHYVKKAFISPHHHLNSPLSSPFPSGLPSPGPPSTEHTFLSSVGDSDSNDSDEELDVIAVDEMPSSVSPSTKSKSMATAGGLPVPSEQDQKQVKDFVVVTDNPMPIIEVSDADRDNASPVVAPPSVVPPTVIKPPHSGSNSSNSSSPTSSLAASASSSTTLPPAPPSAAVFPNRSPGHDSHASIPTSPPPLHMPPGPLASFMASHSSQPSPDPMSSAAAAAWLPPQFHHHNHNNSAYAFPATPVHTEYACNMCDAKLLSFHDFETHCFSDHFRYPCMYCTKTFAQKANRDRHVCIHTGEKPYPCPECDQKFARGDKLKIHRTKWHNIQFPSTYSRPKEGAGSGEWPSSRRKDDEMMTSGTTLKDSNSGQWSDPDPDSQDRAFAADSAHNSCIIGIKAEKQATTSSIGPE